MTRRELIRLSTGAMLGAATLPSRAHGMAPWARSTRASAVSGTQFAHAREALAGDLSGDIVRPDDPRYDTLRQVWNGAANRRPALIVRVRTADDVAKAIQFARDQGLPLAVRSGGHSIVGHGTVDGGLVIDTSTFKALEIDPERRVARAQAGLTTGEYSAAAQAHGLATSTGDTSSVGLAGLTLGGGVGWIVRQQGLTIDNVLAVDLVTLKGEQIRATADEHADLFWALRGGGGNYGVATSFDLRLHQTPHVLGGMVFYSAVDAVQVIRTATNYARNAPDALTIQLLMMSAPPAPFISPNQHGQLAVAVMFCCTGEMTQAERSVAPLRALATPIGEMVSAMPYPGIFAMTEQATVKGEFHDVRSTFLNELDAELIEAVVEHSARTTQVYPRVQIRVLGGAMARVPGDQTAFAHRDKPFLFSIFSSSPDRSDWLRNQPWLESFWRAIQPSGDGVYVNFLSDEGADRVRDAYPPGTFARLIEVKKHYDPENVFRLNQNIPPA